MTVKNPKIFSQLRALDFGAGFYLTSSEQQATKWAKSVCKRRQTGIPTLNVYHLNEFDLEFNLLNVLTFERADGDWLDFVVKNRRGENIEKQYDIVIGPVANDTTIRVIDDYMDGVYTKEEAIKRLLPQNLTDQYAFLTKRALDLLAFERSKIV